MLYSSHVSISSRGMLHSIPTENRWKKNTTPDHVAERPHLSTTVSGSCVNVITAEGRSVILYVWSADRSGSHSIFSRSHGVIREQRLRQLTPRIKLYDTRS